MTVLQNHSTDNAPCSGEQRRNWAGLHPREFRCSLLSVLLRTDVAGSGPGVCHRGSHGHDQAVQASILARYHVSSAQSSK